MAGILNSVMLVSDTAILYRDNLFSSLRFTQKHSHSTLSLTQTNSIWLKLSHPSFSSQTHSHLPRLVPNICTKKTSLIHSDSTWWWQPSWILPSWFLPSWIQPFLHKKNFTHSFWLNLMIVSHLEFCQFAFSHLSFPSQTHSHLPRLIPTICTKKTSLIHSDSTGWWQPSCTLPCWMQTLASWIQTPCYLLSDSLKNTLHPIWLWLNLILSHLSWWWQPSWILSSWILVILDSALLVFPLNLTHTFQDWFPPFRQKNFTHSFWLNLMMAAILNSALMNSAILHKMKFTHSFWLNLMVGSILNSSILISAILDSAILHKKKFHSFILTQLDDDSHLEFCHVGFRHFHLGFRHLGIFFQIHSKPLLLHSDFDSNKFNHSHLTWWWQPSWFLPTWIPPFWIQPS